MQSVQHPLNPQIIDMKLFLLLLSMATYSSTPILVIDTGLKNEVKLADDFTLEMFFNRTFPLYTEDLDAIIAGTEKLARTIDRGEICRDTIRTNRTNIYLNMHCDEKKSVTVRYVTTIEGAQQTFDFALFRNEASNRKAQLKLLDFSAYLSRRIPVL